MGIGDKMKATAKDIANMILALPEEQQNLPLIYEYYDDNESSVPTCSQMEGIRFCKTSYSKRIAWRFC